MLWWSVGVVLSVLSFLQEEGGWIDHLVGVLTAKPSQGVRGRGGVWRKGWGDEN